MTRAAILVAGALGGAAILRAALFYAGVDRLALVLVVAMAAALIAGLVELLARVRRFDALGAELAALPKPASNESVASASPALRSVLNTRIEHAASPAGGAVFTPYLVGLLVMLGLLGTFLGLFETLRGAREALTSSADVDALRSGLALPMQGLTRSFGTSAAGVSASAALGLAAVFARRAEAAFAFALGAYASGPLARLTTQHRQLAALEALVQQGAALPVAATALESAVARLADLERAWGDAHAKATAETARALRSIADEVRADLGTGIARAADATREAAAPLVERAIAGTVEAAKHHVQELRAQLELDLEARRTHEAAQASRVEEHVGRLVRAEEARAAALDVRWNAMTGGLAEGVRALQSELAQAGSAGRAQLEALSEADRDRRAQMDAIVARVDAVGTSLAETTERQVAAVASLLEATEARARAGDARTEAQIDGLLAKVGAAAEAQASHLAEFEAEISKSHGEATARLAREIGAQGAALAETQERQALAIASLLETTEARMREGDTRAEGRIDALVAKIGASVETQASHLARFETEIAKSHGEAASQLTREIGAHGASIVQAADRQAAAVASLLEATTARAREGEARAEERLDALVAKIGASAEAQASHLARFEAEIAKSHGEAASQLTREIGAHGASIAQAADRQAAAVASLLEATTARVREGEARAEKRIDALVAKVGASVETQASHLARFEAQIAKSHDVSASQLVAEIAEHGASVARAAEGQVAAVASLLEATEARAREAETRGDARIDGLVLRIGEAVEAQGARLAQFEDAVAKSHGEAAAQLVAGMTAHGADVDAKLAATAGAVAEAAELLRASGGELTAIAEAFSVAVDRHNDGATRWLEGLGAVEAAVEEAGEAAAAGALGEYLARTQEVFDRQLRVQLELFKQLRALRGVAHEDAGEPLRGDDAPA